MNKFPESDDIIKASEKISEYINKTPILTSTYINEIAECNVFFKCENFQKAGAFKSRGASNALFNNLELAKKYGVATHSSGNHAQALARVARYAGLDSYIVMPENSNLLKVEAVKEYGGKISFCAPTLKSREETLESVIKETGAIEIHPYNNFYVIAGQATVAKEVFDEIKSLDYIIAPVGGGGLLSGTALSAHYFSQETRVVGAEPELANDAYKSFKTKSFVPNTNANTIADGLRTSLGTLTFPIILKYVDDIFTVSEEEIVEAMKMIWLRMKIIIEPSSAVPLSVIIKNKNVFKNKNVAVIISGGNADIFNLPWNE